MAISSSSNSSTYAGGVGPISRSMRVSIRSFFKILDLCGGCRSYFSIYAGVNSLVLQILDLCGGWKKGMSREVSTSVGLMSDLFSILIYAGGPSTRVSVRPLSMSSVSPFIRCRCPFLRLFVRPSVRPSIRFRSRSFRSRSSPNAPG